MKIDLHVHTSERSPCAKDTEQDQIRAAIEAGLDGIAITDHDRLVPRDHLRALNAQYAPFKIFTGIEVQAEDHHWLVLGIHDFALQRTDWQYPDLHRFVQDSGGCIILAHPFRYRPEITVNIDQYPPDGVEVKSYNTPPHREPDIRALAERLHMALICNSDAHRAAVLGQYGMVLPRPVVDDASLVKMVRGLYQYPPVFL